MQSQLANDHCVVFLQFITFCMLIRGASPACWTDTSLLKCVPSYCKIFAFAFINFILCGPVFHLADWADRSTCLMANSTDLHKLSVKRWLSDNMVPTADSQGPAGHYRAITSEILVWTCGGKLMCCCDERLWEMHQPSNWGDRINFKLS